MNTTERLRRLLHRHAGQRYCEVCLATALGVAPRALLNAVAETEPNAALDDASGRCHCCGNARRVRGLGAQGGASHLALHLRVGHGLCQRCLAAAGDVTTAELSESARLLGRRVSDAPGPCGGCGAPGPVLITRRMLARDERVDAGTLIITAGRTAPHGLYLSVCCGYRVSAAEGETLPVCRWCDDGATWARIDRESTARLTL